MKKIQISILSLTLIVLSTPSIVSAIGISATPATLSARTAEGKEAMVRFIVSNPSKEVGLFEAYPEEFEGYITLVPKRFVLEAGEEREVILRAKRPDTGIIRTVIAIEAEPLGIPSRGIGGGVRLPFLLEVQAQNGLVAAAFFSPKMPMFALFVLVALTSLFLIRRVLLSTLKRLLQGGTL